MKYRLHIEEGAAIRSYNPGRDDRWKVRGSEPYNPPNVKSFGQQLEAASYQHRTGPGNGEMLPWYRHPTPFDRMTGPEQNESYLVSRNYPGVSEMRLDSAGVKWWHLRATAYQVRSAGLLPAIEEPAAVAAAKE